jgi:peptide/nickel transport system ATP-binding protein
VTVVRGVDLDLFPDEVLGLVGESGSGKSVTALAIAGLLDDTAKVGGRIRVGEVEVIGAKAETLRRLRATDVGMIFQDPTTSLNPVLTVGWQVIEGEVALGRVRREEAGEKAAAALREVEIPDPAARAAQYPHQFSGGMRQRAVIAMATAGQKQLIIADEPTTALDVTVQAQMLALLARRRAESHAAVLLITHDLGVVAETAERVAVMYAGRIVETADVATLFARPRHPYTVGLLRSLPRLDGEADRLEPIRGQPPVPARLPSGCAFHPRCAWAQPLCAAEAPALREGVACHFPLAGAPPLATGGQRTAAAMGPPLLEVRGLRVHFPLRSRVLRRVVGQVRAVDGVDLTLGAGETLGLVGESGCGKTTTGRAIMGLLPVTEGQVLFEGRDITGLDRGAMRPVRRHMQYVFQDPFASLNPVLSAGEIVAEPLRIHGLYDELGGSRYVASLFERVGLDPGWMERLPRHFSGGQKQRIGIARALALRPRLLILDEPVAALDVSIQAQIVNLLQDLQRDLGLTYLFIAHDLAVVRHICDRVAVMYLGRIVEEGPRDLLYGAPAHPYTQGLLASVPVPEPGRRGMARATPRGEIPSPARPPSGCTFHPRCPRADARCAAEAPVFRDLGTRVACHHAGSGA